MQTADALLTRWDQLKSERAPFDRQWQEVAKYTRPSRQEMVQHYTAVMGERPPVSDAYIVDDTSMLASDNYSGGVFAFLSNPATEWARLRLADDDLNKFHSVREWLDAVNARVKRTFSPARSNFYSEVAEMYGDTPAFGTGCFYNEVIPGEGKFFDRCVPMTMIWVDVDNWGRIIAVYRLVYWTPNQAAEKFTKEKLSPTMQAKVETSNQALHPFIHVVYPNTDYQPARRLDRVKGRPLIDVYIEVDNRHQVKIDGRYDFPYQIARWAGNGKYGYGLGFRNLPSAKMVNAMDRALLEMTEYQARPSVLAHDEMATEQMRLRPRGVTYGAINNRGQRMVDFLAPQGSVPLTHEAVEARKQAIRDAWMFSMLTVQGRTGMNVEETLERQEDKMRIMGPSLARQQSEFLTPLIARRFNELERRGAFPPPPPEIQDEEIEVEYVSPMAVAQVAMEARGTMQLVEATGALGQIDPAAFDNLDTDAAFEAIHRGLVAPAGVARSPEERDQRRQAREAQRQTADTLTEATAGAEIANKLGIQVPQGDANAA